MLCVHTILTLLLTQETRVHSHDRCVNTAVYDSFSVTLSARDLLDEF